MNGLIVVANLAAGFVGGAVAWFATNFWGKPISKFLDLRLQAQEAILFHANIGPYLADAERTQKRATISARSQRRLAALPRRVRRLSFGCFESAVTTFT